MPFHHLKIQNLPYSITEYNGCVPMNERRHATFDDSSSGQSSPSSDHSWEQINSSRTRRRRRGVKAHGSSFSPPHDKPMTKNDLYFALDCEMVGVGPEGLDSSVARVTICNWAEKVVLDTFVQVPTEVTDYRTFVSGIEPKDLEGSNAISLEQVRALVKNILHGKILIGHALENDLAALKISHPWHDIRDTANYPPYMKEFRDVEQPHVSVLRPRKLKELVLDRLGRDIQEQGKAHNPVEDARAALRLYKEVRKEWELFMMAQVQASSLQAEERESESCTSDRSVNGYGSSKHCVSSRRQSNTNNRHSVHIDRSKWLSTPSHYGRNSLRPQYETNQNVRTMSFSHEAISNTIM